MIPPYRAQVEESMQGRHESPVTAGYHRAIIILISRRVSRGWGAALRMVASSQAHNHVGGSCYSDVWNLPVNRSQAGIGKVPVDVREGPTSEKLSG